MEVLRVGCYMKNSRLRAKVYFYFFLGSKIILRSGFNKYIERRNLNLNGSGLRGDRCDVEGI